MQTARALTAVLLLAALARAWTVERSLSSAHPVILTWEFFQDPVREAWDSAEIVLALKPGIPVVSRVLSWPSEGPWSVIHPRLEILEGGVLITAWRGPSASAGPAPIATLSLELAPEAVLGFDDVQQALDCRGLGLAPVAAGPTGRLPAFSRPVSGRDALGRYGPLRSWKWRTMVSTMRGDALPSP